MKNTLFILIFLAFPAFAATDPWSTPAYVQPDTGRSVESCYQAALERSEKIAIQDELVLQNQELSVQAKGAVLPVITGLADYVHQGSASIPGNASSGSEQNTIRVNADQPLFRGFREFAAIRQRKNIEGAQRFALQDAARQLFYDTVTAYYNVQSLLYDKANYDREIEVNKKRLSELQGFSQIGRSRVSEVLTQQAQISALEAQKESTQGALNNALEVLAFLTGQDRSLPLRDVQPLPVADLPVDHYLASLENRPDVSVAKTNVVTAEEGVSIARGGHLPSADLLGNYYLVRSADARLPKWDLTLALTLPIFQGGEIQSQVRQASSVERQNELLLSQARRIAEQEIRQFYDAFSADSKQVVKLQETTELAKKNYESEQRDYRNGLVTNLEVLQAITTWQDSRRTLDHQYFTVKSDYIKLLAASGQRPEIYIESKSGK